MQTVPCHFYDHGITQFPKPSDKVKATSSSKEMLTRLVRLAMLDGNVVPTPAGLGAMVPQAD